MYKPYSPDRRKLLNVGSALAAASFFGVPNSTIASLEDFEQAIDTFTNGVVPTSEKITLTLPEVAENGFSVPVSFFVESPMNENDFVEAVMIFTTDNPDPEVVSMKFSPISGKASGATRMRLARSQDVVAIAKMSDGSLYKDTKAVMVTIGGCGS